VCGNIFSEGASALLLTPLSFMTTLVVGLRPLQTSLVALEQVLRVFAIEIWSAWI
jgi:hypothetical protein